MLNSLINVHYCYIYLINQTSIGLLLYAHIPAALLAILFGSFVLYKTRNLTGVTFFMVCLSFAIWCFLSISTWFAFLGSANTMFTWSLIDFFGLIMFFFSYYFLYVYVTKRDLPIWQGIIGFVLILPTAIWTFLGMSLTLYDSNNCAAIEYDSIVRYPYFVEAVFIIVTLIFIFNQYIKTKDSKLRKEILLAGSGVSIFLVFFFSSTLLVNLLASGDASLYVYNYEIYGLFGMPILLAFMVYVIVKFKVLNIKIFGAQALVLSLIVLIGSEFFFLQSTTATILAAVTLVITGGIGINLMRSVKKEITLREQIEKQEKELQVTNQQLSEFMSFASHEIRAPITSMKGYASLMLEHDLGEINPKVKDAAQKILISSNSVVSLISQYLNKSKIELGELSYTMTVFDIGKMVKDAVQSFQVNADQKGITLTEDVSAGVTYNVNADEGKIREVIGNLIDNAVKYTPEKGSVVVTVTQKDGKVLVKVADTGHGIPKDVISKLFKKFSRADAQKANLLGTGLGLYLSKTFIDAHKESRIWAESEGVDKGSQFYVELPAKQVSEVKG